MTHAGAGALRVAYVSPRYSPHIGGVETHVVQLATRAAALGHTVEVLTQEADRRIRPVEILDGVTVRRFRVPLPSQHFAAAPGLWSYLAQYGRRYDLIHAHSYHAIPALGAALASRRPLVFTPHYHGTGHSPLRRLLHVPYRAAGAAIFARARQVICVSEAEAALVGSHFPYVAGRISVIPNGVEVAMLRAAEPFAAGRTVILSVGRLEDYKNVQRLVEASVYLDDRYDVVVIGDGPERTGLEALASRLGVQGRVRFLGRVDDTALRRWFRTATTFVSLSQHEAFGITLLEALAAGARVIASDIPAHRDVASGAGGALALVPLQIAPRDLAALLRSAGASRSGNVSRVQVASWDEVAAQTLALYRAALIADTLTAAS